MIIREADWVLSVRKPFENKTVTEVFRPNDNLWGWLGIKYEQTLRKQNGNWSISPS